MVNDFWVNSPERINGHGLARRLFDRGTRKSVTPLNGVGEFMAHAMGGQQQQQGGPRGV